MKKLSMLLLIACVSFFAACGDDDKDPVVTKDHAAAVAGTYNGKISVDLGAGDPTTIENKDITITKSGENKVNLELKNFAFEALEVGDIKVSDVEVKESKDGYTMSPKTVTLDLANGELKGVKVTISNGTFIGSKMSIKLDIQAGPLTIVVTIDNASKK